MNTFEVKWMPIVEPTADWDKKGLAMIPQYKVDDIKNLLAELCNLACINTDAYEAKASDFSDDEVRKFCADVELVLNGEAYDSE